MPTQMWLQCIRFSYMLQHRITDGRESNMVTNGKRNSRLNPRDVKFSICTEINSLTADSLTADSLTAPRTLLMDVM